MKLKYGSAFTDNSDIDSTLMLPLDADRQVPSSKFIEIVEARVQEIIENVCNQVPSEYDGKLLGGIILTGGGSKMKNIERAFRIYTHIEKVRIAKFVTQTIKSSDAKINAHDGTMNTVLGLLAKGDMNCAGEEITGSLFDSGTQKPTTADIHANPRPITETSGRGIVQTEAEKKADEEARKKAAEEAAEKARKQKEAEEEEKRRKENSPFNKLFRNVKKLLNTITQEEE